MKVIWVDHIVQQQDSWTITAKFISWKLMDRFLGFQTLDLFILLSIILFIVVFFFTFITSVSDSDL